MVPPPAAAPGEGRLRRELRPRARRRGRGRHAPADRCRRGRRCWRASGRWRRRRRDHLAVLVHALCAPADVSGVEHAARWCPPRAGRVITLALEAAAERERVVLPWDVQRGRAGLACAFCGAVE